MDMYYWEVLAGLYFVSYKIFESKDMYMAAKLAIMVTQSTAEFRWALSTVFLNPVQEPQQT